MTIIGVFFAFMAANPVLAAVATLACFALSVWSMQPFVVSLLTTWRARQTVNKCDRWAIECDEARRTNGCHEGRRKWWRRGLSNATRRFLRSKDKDEELHHRCEVSSCTATGEVEVCPKYVEELRLLTEDDPPAAAASPTPASSSGQQPGRKLVGSIRNALNKAQRGIGTTTRRLTKGGGEAIRSVGRAVGCKAKGTWRKMRKGALATRNNECNNPENEQEVDRAPAKASHAKSDVKRGGSDNASKPRRFLFGHWRQPLSREAPATVNLTSDGKVKLLAAERALGGNTPSALHISLGVNMAAFTAVGLWCFMTRRGCFRPRWQKRRRRPPQQRRQAEGDPTGVAPRVGDDSGSSIREGMSAPAATPALRPRQLTAREPCLTWEDWDDPSLKDFLLEEARTFSNPAERRQQVVEWDERVALSHLARDWKVPFLSKRDFMQQQETAKGLPHVMDENGRLVPRCDPSSNDGDDGVGATEPPRQQPQEEEEPLYWQRQYRRIQRRQVLWIRSPPRRAAVPSPPKLVGTSPTIRSPPRRAAVPSPPKLVGTSPTNVQASTDNHQVGSTTTAGISLQRLLSSGCSPNDHDSTGFGNDFAASGVPPHRACVTEWGRHKGVVYYAVEVETMGQRKATLLYRRYTHFLQLWKEVCRTHPNVRDFSFPRKEPPISAKVVLAEIFGRKRLEDERQARFCDLLQLLMSLDPRPPALLDFLAPGSPGEARAAAPAATFSDQRDRSAFVPEQEREERQEPESSSSQRSKIGSSRGSPSPEQCPKPQPQQQQRKQQQQQHERGRATGRGLLPAGGNNSTTAVADPHGSTVLGGAEAPATAPLRGVEEEQAATPATLSPTPIDVCFWINLVGAVSAIILDAVAIFFYARGVASSLPGSPSFMSSLLNLFVRVGAIGPAIAVAVVVRVFCCCHASWQRGQGWLYPFQVFISSRRLRRHRMAARPVWRREWREVVWNNDFFYRDPHRVLVAWPVKRRSRMRSFWGTGMRADGAALEEKHGVGVSEAGDPGETLRSVSGDAVEANGGLGSGRASGGDSVGSGREACARTIETATGALVETRGRGRSRSRKPRRCAAAGRVRSLSETRSPGRPSTQGTRAS